jgi:predicted amidophosphoribosyltransferase
MNRTCPACSARLDQHATICPQCGINLATGGIETTETGAVDEEIRNTAVAAHLSTFAGLAVPFGSVIGPLAV